MVNSDLSGGGGEGAIQTCIFLNPPDLCKDSDIFQTFFKICKAGYKRGCRGLTWVWSSERFVHSWSLACQQRKNRAVVD